VVPLGSAVDLPASTSGDTAELLDVEVDQLARPGHLDTADRGPGGAVQVVEAIEPAASQDPVDGGGRHLHDAGDAGWAKTLPPAQRDDPALP
jgi:hypothetical protein